MATLAKFDQSQHLRFSAESLHSFAVEVFCSSGLDREPAILVVDSLVDANLRGVDTHGLTRLLHKYVERVREQRVNLKPDIRIIRETPSTAVIDGDNGLGAIVSRFAIDVAIQKAKEAGSCWIGVRRSNHFGACGYWTRLISEADMIGFGVTNGPSNMAPWGGFTPYHSTNPISFAAPTGKGWNIVLDFSTAVAARGNMILFQAMGLPIPEGWSFDAQGNPTTDADEAMKGTVVPIAGHKGYGLSFFIDLLCGILAGAQFGPHIGRMYGEDDREQDVGHVFSSVNIEAMEDIEVFKRSVDQMIDEVHDIEPKKGFERIFVPGEIEAETTERRRIEGIPIPDEIIEEFRRLSEETGVPMPSENGG